MLAASVNVTGEKQSESANREAPPLSFEARLYGLPGSAPSYSAELMLRHKRIPYRRRNLIPGRHRKTLPAKGFPGGTVPAIVVQDQLIQTNRAIARGLDELVPDRPLFPAQARARAKVEDAEKFGDEVLQDAVRRMIIWSLSREPGSVRAHPRIGAIPIPRNRLLRGPFSRRAFKMYGINEEVVGRDFDALPAMLDKLDAYVEAGVLNGEQLTAADLEIAPLIGALLGVADLGAEVGRRPVAGLADRVLAN
jgi:glutathione S-transferase